VTSSNNCLLEMSIIPKNALFTFVDQQHYCLYDRLTLYHYYHYVFHSTF